MAGAPATELTTLGAGAARELREPLQVLTIAGLAAAYPDADPATILTPAGRAFVEQLDAGCPAAPNPDTDSPLLSADPTTTEPWAGLLADNTPGGVSAEAPVLVIHSAADMNVLIDDSARLLDRLCAAGQVVERRVLPTGDHVAAAIPAYEQAFTWFDTLTQGTPPQSSCP
jgi:acetyl esterase/lipase